MKTLISYLLAAVATCAILYGSYLVIKHGSYWLWYEGMVKDTIREMVKQEALNDGS